MSGEKQNATVDVKREADALTITITGLTFQPISVLKVEFDDDGKVKTLQVIGSENVGGRGTRT